MIQKFKRIAIIAVVPIVLTLVGLQMTSAREVSTAASVENYPVILIHGLGGGPGDKTFGNLETYLKDFYFDVEVMDFNEFSNNNLAQGENAGELGNLAAVLGLKIKRVLKQYNAEKVDIIAHSYGGLIAHAYINNFGAQFDEKNGGYNSDVNRVVYIQVPFYGTLADQELVSELASTTDYGPYTDPVKIVSTLKVGSEWLYNLDTATRSSNIYAVVDALTIVTSDDLIVQGLLGTLAGTSDVLTSFKSYRVFNFYSHTVQNLSDSKLGAFTYVNSPTDRNFLCMVSFLDGGRKWKRMGTANISPNGMLMVKFEKAKGANKIAEEDVTLTLLKKKKKKTKAASEPFTGILNPASRVYSFLDLQPGFYNINISSKKAYEDEIELKDLEQLNYAYYPKENKLEIAGLEGLFSLAEFTLKGPGETAAFPLPGLNTNNFEIEFIVSGVNSDNFNKGIVLGLYNAKGAPADANNNGGLIEIVLRGKLDPVHSGRIMIIVNVDRNKNRFSEPIEKDEVKSVPKYSWNQPHLIKLSVQNLPAGSSRFKIWVDNKLVIDTDYNYPYFNDSPVLSLGGESKNDEKVSIGGGALIKNLVVRNTP